MIYLVCCRGKIHWLWRQRLSGTNQPREGDTGPFPPVMDMHIFIFGAGEFVTENPTLPQILHRPDCSDTKKRSIRKSHIYLYTHSCRSKVSHTLLVLYCILSELNNRLCKEMIRLWPHISMWSYCKRPHNLDRIHRVEFYAHYLQIPITKYAWARNGRQIWVLHGKKSYIMKGKYIMKSHWAP